MVILKRMHFCRICEYRLGRHEGQGICNRSVLLR